MLLYTTNTQTSKPLFQLISSLTCQGLFKQLKIVCTHDSTRGGQRVTCESQLLLLCGSPGPDSAAGTGPTVLE